MSGSGSKTTPAVGFLTVVEDKEHGIFGGYLVLNTVGRPIEFHCTAPVKANRAQEILYGPTLRPYLCGEQIAQTLIAKGKVKPMWVCTDDADVLDVREFSSIPVAMAMKEDEPASNMRTFEMCGRRFAVAGGHDDDGEQVVQSWSQYGENFDLLEPFDRIREALNEAQGRKAEV